MENQKKQLRLERKALEKCLIIARDSGVPREQAERFIRSGYVPLPWQWEFHAAARAADLPDGPVDIGAGGARGPGKSHAVLSQVALDDCQRVDGLKCLFLRQTGVAAKESFDDLIEKVVAGHLVYERVGGMLKVGKGSRIVLGGFKDANDIDKYIGIEYDVIIVEELNQLTEEKYTKLRGSLRTSKPNWRPRMYTSFNPGGLGHDFVKTRYILPNRADQEKETRFVGSTYRSNPYLNREYIEYLEGLGGDLGKSWREGEWDLFTGMAFPEFRYNLHGIRPLIPAISFEHFFSADWGYTDKKPHAFAAYLHAVIKMKLPDGQNFHRVITYREWAGNLKTPDQWATIIYQDCLKMGIKPLRGDCDSAMFNTQTDGSKAISKLMMDKWKELNRGEAWIPLAPGTKNRIGRKATIHNWLSLAPDGLPYWMIGTNCRWLLETIPKLIYDENHPEDVDTDGPDDPYDSVGYFLTKVKFMAVKGGPLAYRTQAQPQRIRFTPDGQQQIPLDVKEFQNQYRK